MSNSLQGNAQQVIRTGGFDLPCAADTAFPLFSPVGEGEWVLGWNPIAAARLCCVGCKLRKAFQQQIVQLPQRQIGFNTAGIAVETHAGISTLSMEALFRIIN
jgi:hypothetical protein